MLYKNLTYTPHVAHGYHVKLQHQGYTERHTTENIYIYICKIAIKLTSVGLAHARPNNYMFVWYMCIPYMHSALFVRHAIFSHVYAC